ncbi:phenylalanyl-tRNA synthetase beta subunit [Cryptosporidium ubiquitum]|uniref:phenylalanine--tRNA ligase n=1 Tax=Cryptosporidium ubiquitum TaxID=857276 RepID=A0A1J4ML54_9CRYT|nr:phenylalanyl-tRNA synthetase beta subunit [Cryptosporidium ubiquitum]OII73764.1 phenylalanyl-tRNA synthetase beta subunit [Cryptosporidium ubiquitum]
MPVVSVSTRLLSSHLNKEVTSEWLDELCFNYGLELDSIEFDEELKENVAKIEIPANRPDILCLEGLVIALGCFIGSSEIPLFNLKPRKSYQKMIVRQNVVKLRPFILCAVLRDLSFNEDIYKSFIDYQEKLHNNICRKRSLVSIGTHDLDKIEGPFYYDAKPRNEIQFVPLIGTTKVDGSQLLDLLSKHQQLKKYVPLVENEILLPVVTDKNGIVLSVPPLINGNQSKITLDTKNVFIEVTATDYNRAYIVLNQIVSAFSLYSKSKFEIEPVIVEYEHSVYPPFPHKYQILSNGSYQIITPNIERLEFVIKASDASDLLGIKPILDTNVTQGLLRKMMIDSEIINKEDGILKCFVPINRSDILHPVDIIEDIGISYGFNNIQLKKLRFCDLDKLNLMSEQVKRELSLLGISEALNWALCKHSDCFESLFREENIGLKNLPENESHYSLNFPSVVVKDAKTSEFEILRTTLIQSLLKTMASNKSLPLPQKVFEVGDVVILDDNTPSGARNDKRVAIAYCNSNGSGLEEIHGFLDQLLSKLGLVAKYSLDEPNAIHPNIIGMYSLCEVNDPTFLPTRSVQINIQKVVLKDCFKSIDIEKTMLNKQIVIGIMGVIHPKVLSNFSLTLPTSMLELRLEPIMKWWPDTFFYDE